MSAVARPAPAPRTQRASAFRVLEAVDSVLTERVTRRRLVCDRAWRAGHPPHPIKAGELDRAEHLREQHRAAHAAFAELAYVVAQELSTGHPRLATQLRAALARVQEMPS